MRFLTFAILVLWNLLLFFSLGLVGLEKRERKGGKKEMKGKDKESSQKN